jgi:hypothetical protein
LQHKLSRDASANDGALPGDLAIRQQSPVGSVDASVDGFPAERTAALAVHDALQYYRDVLRDIECKPRRGPSKGTSRMANPWLKKNPLMSMWLSAANAAAGRARSAAAAEARRQQAALTKQTIRFWTRAWQAAVKPRRRR